MSGIPIIKANTVTAMTFDLEVWGVRNVVDSLKRTPLEIKKEWRKNNKKNNVSFPGEQGQFEKDKKSLKKEWEEICEKS